MMSNLQGQAGDTGQLFLPASILGSWNSVDDQLIFHGQGGPPGEQGQLDLVEKARPSGPIQFVIKLLGFWRLEKSDAVKLLGFGAEETEYVHRLLQGKEQLYGRDVKDRIGHLFHIRGTLRALFRDLPTENDWLREEHSLLDEKSPLEILLEGSMESLLFVREYVDTVAGM